MTQGVICDMMKVALPQEEEEAAEKELRLSDAFLQPSPPGKFEWTARMVNLNQGKNDELLQKCKPLADYMFLIQQIRERIEAGMVMEQAVDEAVVTCISQDVLKDFLIAHRAEVVSVGLREFDERLIEEIIRESAREEGLAEGKAQGLAEGRAEGRAEGMFLAFAKMVREGFLSLAEGAKEAGISQEEFVRRMNS